MLELNPKTVFDEPIPKMEGPLEWMLGVEMFPRQCKLTEPPDKPGAF